MVGPGTLPPRLRTERRGAIFFTR